MKAGKLRHRIELQSNAPTQDSYGEPIASWTTDDTVWASIEPLSGRELLRAQEVHAEVTTRIRVRYPGALGASTLTADDRIKHGARIFEIAAVINPDERDRELELLCVEAV